jgi:hypothetical protein
MPALAAPKLAAIDSASCVRPFEQSTKTRDMPARCASAGNSRTVPLPNTTRVFVVE